MSRIIPNPARLSRHVKSPLSPPTLLRSQLHPHLPAQRPHSIRSISTSPHPPTTPRKLPWQSALLTLLTISAAAYTLRPTTPEHNDAPPTSTPVSGASGIHGTTTDNEDHPIDQIPTGTSKVPFFPRKIYLPSTPHPSNPTSSASLPAGLGAAAETEEYILLGQGVRKVSFLRIQVYVVGLYIAKSDLAALQERMIHAVASTETASTLVSSEKADLKARLLDPEGSQEIWAQVLRQGGIRSAMRITPVRDTNMGHMRDGFVRMVNAGAGREGCDERTDVGFREAVQGLKIVLGGASQVGTGRVLLLGRGGEGGLSVWAERGGKVEAGAAAEKVGQMLYLGGVRDERIARWVWMGYLAGAKVATEGARESVVNGVLDLVERPIGTVETQVI